MRVRFCDRTEFGLGWIASEPALLHRASHALLAGERVWLVDPVEGEGVEQRILALGEPGGVIQLLDRHERDGPALAERFGVPLHRLPTAAIPGAPFEAIAVVQRRRWREVALWWPERRVLVCADALGTAPYYLAPGERLALHPLLRLAPPRPLRTRPGSDPRHVLCGHGEGIHGPEATLAFEEALESSRRRIPGYLFGLLRRRR